MLQKPTKKPLTKRFRDSALHLLHLKEKPAFAYAHLVRLFNFHDEGYVTVPGKQYVVRNHFNMSSAQSVAFGPIRTFYADPGDVSRSRVVQDTDSIEREIPGDPVSMSAGILANEDISEFGHRLMVVIRDRLRDPELEYDTMVFGLYGSRSRDGHVKLRKMLVPKIDNANRMTGLREVDLYDCDDVARALSYAHLCVAQIMGGEGFNPRDNMKAVMADQPELQTIPWKKPPPAAP